MRQQPQLHHGQSSALSRLGYAALWSGLVLLGAIAFAIGGFLAMIVWLPAIIIAGIAAIVFIAIDPRKNWNAFRNWWERQGEIATEAVSHVSTSPTLLAERYAERDGGGFFLTMAPGRRCEGRREPAMLSLRDDRHVTLICGSRGGKGRSIILPNLARWHGSAIIHDPAGELVAISGPHRRTVLGQRVLALDPFGVTGSSSACWNPFDEIPTNDPFLVEKVRLVSESLIERTGSDTYWSDAARSLLTGVILHVLTAATPEARNLYTVRQLLTDGTPDAVWHAMQNNDALDGLVRQYGQENASREPKELTNVLQSARIATDWIDTPAMRQVVSHSTFRMIDLKRERVSLYLVLPPGRGATFNKWLRLLFNMAFDAFQDQSVAKPDEDVLFVLDEFPLLGNMERIKRAAGEAAKFGVKLFIVAQDVGQLKEHYGEFWETFVANSFLLIMFANNDLASLEYASARVGKGWFQKIVTTVSSGEKGGSSTATSQELQDIARATDINRHASRQSGEAYFFVAGLKPWRLQRANYDEWGFFEEQGTRCPAVERLTVEARHV
jgi:type IV secretion system protein VirD4